MITTNIIKNVWQSVSRSLINVSGNKSTVLSSKGFKKAILEIPHQVHDVVSKTRRTEGYHGRIRTGKSGVRTLTDGPVFLFVGGGWAITTTISAQQKLLKKIVQGEPPGGEGGIEQVLSTIQVLFV